MNVEMENLKCIFCEKQFQHRQSLTRHVKNVHKVKELPKRNCTLKCPEIACEEVFQNRAQLREHVSTAHHVKLVEEEIEFSSFEEFQMWKVDVEKKMKCSYVLRQTPKTLVSKAKVYYYSCFRSGSHISRSTGKREMKCSGSRKIGGYCPSTMDVTVLEGKTYVKFWKTHFGHDVDIGHLFLSSTDKVEIACKLRQGVTFDRILDDVRDSIGQELERIHLLTRKDLHNIARDFHILNFVKLHSDDATSVKLWVDTMNEAREDSPVIYFKEQGVEDCVGTLNKEDFELIIMTGFQKKMLKKFGQAKVCIDSTHGTNSYNFQLTTLMVIDEFGAGCPVAFCLSNRVDETAMTVFLEAVKQKAGSISCTVFMSDDAAAFYNAWKAVMGPSLHQLLCTWHVDRSWRKNLPKISGPQEKKVLVYKALRVLLQEQDVNKFILLLSKFLEQIMQDDQTRAFGEYFKGHYANRTQVWAFCFRPRLGINTNMYLESMHKTLKHYYLEGKKNKRVDKTVNMLMRLSRDKIFDRLIKLTKKVPSEKIKKIRASHQKGLTIDVNLIKQIADNEWAVPSKNGSEFYSVQKIPLEQNCQNCFYTCTECKICIHMYECTCMDNFIHFNICKHIHACLQLVDSTSELEEINNKDEEIKSLLNSSALQNSANKNLKNSLGLMKRKARLLCSLVEGLEDVDEETCSELSKLLDKPISILMRAKDSSYTEENYEPPNKKIKPQQRFFSTKKPNSNKKQSVSKPTSNEKRSIVEGLFGTETVNIHTEFDHIY